MHNKDFSLVNSPKAQEKLWEGRRLSQLNLGNVYSVFTIPTVAHIGAEGS